MSYERLTIDQYGGEILIDSLSEEASIDSHGTTVTILLKKALQETISHAS